MAGCHCTVLVCAKTRRMNHTTAGSSLAMGPELTGGDLWGAKPYERWKPTTRLSCKSSRGMQVETKDWKIERPEMSTKVRVPPFHRMSCPQVGKNRLSEGPWVSNRMVLCRYAGRNEHPPMAAPTCRRCPREWRDRCLREVKSGLPARALVHRARVRMCLGFRIRVAD